MHFLPLSKQHLILKLGKNTKTARNKFGPKRTDNISILAIISIKKKVKKVKKKKKTKQLIPELKEGNASRWTGYERLKALLQFNSTLAKKDLKNKCRRMGKKFNKKSKKSNLVGREKRLLARNAKSQKVIKSSKKPYK